MNFLHQDFPASPDDVIEVTLDGQANVMLLDSSNYDHYRKGESFRYHGGRAEVSPVRLVPPHDGNWHVVVDLGGYAGRVRADVRVLKGANAEEVTGGRPKSRDPRPAPPIVLYAPLGELKIYEISEGELEKLEAGPPGQLHLNFALAMLPAALTILITIQTTTISSDRLYIGYQIAFWALAVQGVISLLRWRTSNRNYGKLIEEIRARMPPKPVVAEQIISTTTVFEAPLVRDDAGTLNDAPGD